MTHPYPYGDREISFLSQADPSLGRAIARFEEEGVRPERLVEDDPYIALMHAINDQLISLKAAASIWSRILHRFGDPLKPAALARAYVEDIRTCGTTRMKAEYLHDLSRQIIDDELDLEGLRAVSDAEVVERLVGLRGIGVWSAEMLLIHAYERPDVISFGDAGIRRGICRVHGLESADLTPELFAKIVSAYHPFATTASIYLWHISKE